MATTEGKECSHKKSIEYAKKFMEVTGKGATIQMDINDPLTTYQYKLFKRLEPYQGKEMLLKSIVIECTLKGDLEVKGEEFKIFKRD